MIRIETDTAPAIAKLAALRTNLHASTQACIANGAAVLLSIVQGKLSGSVLNSRSGALLHSIHTEIVEADDEIGARVFSDGSVPYAHVQEYGGRLNIPAMVPVNGEALAFVYQGRLMFARSTAAHVIDIPARSYMRSSLDEFAPAFVDNVHNAVANAAS
jgi:hypothetical protein